jgi:hypothetical protein
MKARLNLFVIICFLLITAACSTKATYIPSPDAVHVDPGALFAVGEVTDKSGFTFDQNATETVVLTEAMAEALEASLKANGARGDGQYSINVEIISYSPGNAFMRWLMPGLGETQLSVVAHILHQDGSVAARIPVDRSIAAGGGYTIGAWKYVFTDVSNAIVELLVNAEKRTGSKK